VQSCWTWSLASEIGVTFLRDAVKSLRKEANVVDVAAGEEPSLPHKPANMDSILRTHTSVDSSSGWSQNHHPPAQHPWHIYTWLLILEFRKHIKMFSFSNLVSWCMSLSQHSGSRGRLIFPIYLYYIWRFRPERDTQ
jgi:hypothetical protein